MKNIRIKELEFQPFLSESELREAIHKMAEKINSDYADKHLHIVIVLKGAFIFAADLVRLFEVDHTIHFVKFSSYQGTQSTGTIQEDFALTLDPAGKHILIIEDIVDTGNTLNYFVNKLWDASPASVEIAALLFKPDALKHELKIRYRGFDIENVFVVGYGLDYDEKGRNLRHIYRLKS